MVQINFSFAPEGDHRLVSNFCLVLGAGWFVTWSSRRTPMFSMGGLLGVSQAECKSGRISGLTVWVLQGQRVGMNESSAWPGGEGHLDSFIPHCWLQDSPFFCSPCWDDHPGCHLFSFPFIVFLKLINTHFSVLSIAVQKHMFWPGFIPFSLAKQAHQTLNTLNTHKLSFALPSLLFAGKFVFSKLYPCWY